MIKAENRLKNQKDLDAQNKFQTIQLKKEQQKLRDLSLKNAREEQ